MVRSCGAVAARRCLRTTLPHLMPRRRCAGGARLAPPTAHPAHAPCAVPSRTDRASRQQFKTTYSGLRATLSRMTVRELLAELQHLPRDLEILAFEAGCEDYCEREVDELELQGGRVYLHLGARRDEPPQQ
jgi:hypothetical protein